MSETVTKPKHEKCKVIIIGAGMAGNNLFVTFFVSSILLM